VQTIHEIWHSERLAAVRELHNRENGFQELAVCRKCYYPRKAVVDETAQVGERMIFIENYTNRAQEVGK
jgi:hypothetical protein